MRVSMKSFAESAVEIVESWFRIAESRTNFAESWLFAESFVELYPPPLSPSAREGEILLDSAFAESLFMNSPPPLTHFF
ncbi:hypothetical protein [Helicobacter sp. 23-1045]